MSLENELNELCEHGVISKEIATDIENYYKNKQDKAPNKLLAIFAVLGSILIGLGIILIMAHNWDDLSVSIKTIIAFIPLVVGQIACFYAIQRQSDSTAWLEASAASLFFGIGTNIALIAQIYNIPSTNGGFMLIWCLASLPIIYLMRVHTIALFYIACATSYVLQTGNLIYLGLMLAVLPSYYLLLKKSKDENSTSNFARFFNWCIPLSFLMGLGEMVGYGNDHTLLLIYLCAMCLLFQISRMPLLQSNQFFNNGYKVISLVGIGFIMMFFSFEWYWSNGHLGTELALSIRMIPAFIFILLTIGLFVYQNRNLTDFRLSTLNPIGFVGLLFTAIVYIAHQNPELAQWISNLLILSIGLYYIYNGAKRNHFGILNYGLLMVVGLIACRFFDSNLSYVFRGIVFIILGIGLYLINFYMYKRIKQKAQ